MTAQIPPISSSESYDIDKLAEAVAIAETSGCNRGSGVSHNNCFGVMHWPNGVRTLKTYSTKQESYDDFKRIWSSFYGRFPDEALARKWTGNDSPDTWLRNVKIAYSNL